MAVHEHKSSPKLRVDTPSPARRRWTTAEYYKMAEAGILEPNERVELIDGEVIALAPIGPEHSSATEEGYDALRNLLGAEFAVRHEAPIAILDGTEPQPDLYVARGPRSLYRHRHPKPEDLLLVVEVAASSLAADRSRKLSRYAESGIPEVWIVNLVDRRVEIYRDPSGTGYGNVCFHTPGQSIDMCFAAGKSFPVDHLLLPQEDATE